MPKVARNNAPHAWSLPSPFEVIVRPNSEAWTIVTFPHSPCSFISFSKLSSAASAVAISSSLNRIRSNHVFQTAIPTPKNVPAAPPLQPAFFSGARARAQVCDMLLTTVVLAHATVLRGNEARRCQYGSGQRYFGRRDLQFINGIGVDVESTQADVECLALVVETLLVGLHQLCDLKQPKVPAAD